MGEHTQESLALDRAEPCTGDGGQGENREKEGDAELHSSCWRSEELKMLLILLGGLESLMKSFRKMQTVVS